MNQVGGDHYQDSAQCPHCGGELQHWDIAWMFKMDCFQYIITKWVFRHKKKGGRQDLEKAGHAISKYLKVLEPRVLSQGSQTMPVGLDVSGIPGPGYTNQDR